MFRRNAAHLCQSDWHVSIDEPSDHPFYRGYKKAYSGRNTNDWCNSTSAHVSPFKQLSIYSTLIEQLNKCVGILEKCGPGYPPHQKMSLLSMACLLQLPQKRCKISVFTNGMHTGFVLSFGLKVMISSCQHFYVLLVYLTGSYLIGPMTVGYSRLYQMKLHYFNCSMLQKVIYNV